MTGFQAKRREIQMSSAIVTHLASRISQEHAAAADSLPAELISPDRRRSALQALETHGLPSARDENWKYANLRPLEKVRFAPVVNRLAPDVVRRVAEQLPAPVAGYSRRVFVDGVFCPELSLSQERAGVSVHSLEVGPAATLPAGDARFALLNEAFATDGALIRVAAGTDCESCLEIVFAATVDAQTGASYPRIELEVQAGARFGLIERHLSVAGSEANFVNGVVNISLGRGATVKHYRVQQMGLRAVWLDTLAATLAEDAKYRLHTVSLGALSSRSTVNIRLAGERCEVSVYAVAVADLHQSQDALVLVDHRVPRAVTEQVFRGIAAGRSRVGFNGKVVVGKQAHGTDSRQSLRGLLAGPEAEIDVRPQLEIYTDDVKCSHGATAGKLDDDMLFYLLSRGLDRDTAQRLLKWAFLEDVVAKIEVPELRRQIEQSLAGHLNETAALKELI
jgi:Fe-S cluster assembly protein SufD